MYSCDLLAVIYSKTINLIARISNYNIYILDIDWYKYQTLIIIWSSETLQACISVTQRSQAGDPRHFQ
jgi:hypothetical protein